MSADIEPTALHSTRLFPKNRGATAYAITGIAARCDWVLLSDLRVPFTHLRHIRKTDAPRHIFLSLRNPFVALATFANEILPQLRKPFVLVSGSEDCTFPRQLDRRWRRFNDKERQMIAAILDHPMLVRWFCENLDDDSDTRFTPLPVGMVYPSGPPATTPPVDASPQSTRAIAVLCGHRVREGPQWELRRQVSLRAQSSWRSFCTMPEDELSEPGYLTLMRSHAFVLCAEGGGIDPSPKAWQAIVQGAIPIIRRTATRGAYERLPVAFVESWDASELTPARLAEWHRRLAPFFDTPRLRKQTLTRLGLEYWWGLIDEQLQN